VIKIYSEVLRNIRQTHMELLM